MNAEEAKNILLLWRPDTTDAEDAPVAAALALAQRDPELARWLDAHAVRQRSLAEKFRQIPVPAGLKEQIISEYAASRRRVKPQRMKIAALVGVIIVAVAMLGLQFWQPSSHTNSLELYRSQMTGIALRGYGMDFLTNSPAAIHDFLAAQKCPADYVLPAALHSAEVAGCAVENWENKKVSMICFRTGRPLPAGQASDLWLFVAARDSVRHAPPPGPPLVQTENQTVTAVWTEGDKIYLLAMEGDEALIKKFL